MFVGCKNVTIRTESAKELTGIGDNDHDKFMAIMRTIKVDVTTREDLAKMGIRPGEVPNVKAWGGQEAATQFAVGTSPVTVQLNMSTLLDDIVKFRDVQLIRVPYRDIKTTGKRVYFSNNFREVKGHDTMFSILLNKGVVIALPPPKDEKLDTYSKSHAFGRGFIELFGEAAGPVSTSMKIVP
jgi:hypothetical protein